MLLIGESKKDYFFTPILLPSNKFDKTPSCVFDSSILTTLIFSGLKGDTVTGIFIIYESKKQPSFLTKYCLDNKPFINLNIDLDNLVLGMSTDDLTKITIGGGTNLFPTKEMFDKFNIQSLLNSSFTKTDLSTILKSK